MNRNFEANRGEFFCPAVKDIQKKLVPWQGPYYTTTQHLYSSTFTSGRGAAGRCKKKKRPENKPIEKFTLAFSLLSFSLFDQLR